MLRLAPLAVAGRLLPAGPRLRPSRLAGGRASLSRACPPHPPGPVGDQPRQVRAEVGSATGGGGRGPVLKTPKVTAGSGDRAGGYRALFPRCPRR